MDKREFIAWMTGIILTVVFAVGIVEHSFEAVSEGKGIQRARIEACKTVENEGLRVSCIEHAHS